MNGLFAHGSATPITRLIRTVPQQAVNKIVQTTLDGSPHVQIIGNASPMLTIELQVDEFGRSALNQFEAFGTKITVVTSGVTRHGYVMDKAPYTSPIKGQYQTTITVGVVDA